MGRHWNLGLKTLLKVPSTHVREPGLGSQLHCCVRVPGRQQLGPAPLMGGFWLWLQQEELSHWVAALCQLTSKNL